MKGTREKKPQRRPRLTYIQASTAVSAQRKLTLPPDLDKFLTDFAVKEGFSSEVQAIYQILRERKSVFEASSA